MAAALAVLPETLTAPTVPPESIPAASARRDAVVTRDAQEGAALRVGLLLLPAVLRETFADLRERLVVRNTFLHLEEQDDMPYRLLRRSSSAPALRHSLAIFEAPGGESASPPVAELRTTVLFRNVPYLLTRDKFVEILNSHGFQGLFDLVYVPMDFKTNQTLGYAFANATSVEVANRFFDVFEGFGAWPNIRSAKVCSVSWSSRQGLENNVSIYRNLPIMHRSGPEAWKPALFSQGRQVPFPAPTKKVRADRLRNVERCKTHDRKKRCSAGSAQRI